MKNETIPMHTPDGKIVAHIDIQADVLGFVREVFAETKDSGFEMYIAGGYLRDIFCNLVPKDLDLVFVPEHATYASQRVLYTPAQTYVNYRLDSRGMQEGLRERGVFEVTGLFHSKLTTPDIQYIVYQCDDLSSPVAVAQDMDMNICQIVYHVGSNQIYCTDDFWVGHRDKYIECLGSDPDVRKYHRYARMQAKFPHYGVIGCPSPLPNWLTEKSKRQNIGSFRAVD